MNDRIECTEERLWRRVNDCLDARRDPLDDAELARELAAAPRVDADLRRLDARLAAVQAGAAPPRRAAWIPALAAVAMLALGAAWFVGAGSRAAPDPGAGPQRLAGITLDIVRSTPPPPRGARVVLAPRRVLAWNLEGSQP